MMKNNYKLCLRVLYVSLFCIPIFVNAQEDSAKTEPVRESLLYLQYHAKNNQIPYLKLQTKVKTDKGIETAKRIPVSIYLDTDSLKEALVAEVETDARGESIVSLPPALATNWNQSTSHSFIANATATKDYDAATTTTNVTVAKLEVDTTTNENGRVVIARLFKKEGSSWLPVGESDLRIAVKRHGGYLNIGDKDAYTTDSTGVTEGDFLLKDLPGDGSGNLELTAFLDDNEELGTLQTTMLVPWGSKTLQHRSQIEDRSLWAKGNRAPIWLIVMASFCIISVWAIIIYLFTRMRRIWILGIREK
jgi:hypothetical protein